MEDRRKGALRHHHSGLRTGIIVRNFLPDLHHEAGGFLTDVELSVVGCKRGQVDMVDELMKILLTKEDRAFDAFCRVLSKNGSNHWSDKLRGTAQLGQFECIKRGRQIAQAATLLHHFNTQILLCLVRARFRTDP